MRRYRIHRGLLLCLPAVAVLLGAASPQRGLNLQAYDTQQTLPVPPVPPVRTPADAYAPAPTPNRDIDAPAQADTSKTTSVSPNLLTRSETYRGDGFSKGSTSQSEQDKRVRPGAGFNLRVPFLPN